MFKDVVRIVLMFGGFFSVIGSFLAIRFAPLFFVVLAILKIVNAVNISWFGYPNELSAVGTPFWMFFIGIIFYLLGMVFIAIGGDDKIWRK